MVAVVVEKSRQSFTMHYGEEEGCEGEERQRRGVEMYSKGVASLSLPLYILGKGGGGGAHWVSPRGGGGQGRWDLP
jgi:hypothetical protein